MLTPRYYQQGAHDAAWQHLAERPGNPLIVLPTGAGKSLVIAMMIKTALSFGGRVVVLAHRKELLTQNAFELQELMPDVPIGIYSAGLKSKQTTHAVIMGGIQSIYRKAEDLGQRHLVIVDEAHLISDSDETMYGQFLLEIVLHNPAARIVGLTATPYRTGEGPLCGKGKLFQRICYEAQTGDLIDKGFLCPITNKPSELEIDTSSLPLRGGEVVESDAQRLFNQPDTVGQACQEIVTKCHDRKSVLLFSTGVRHAEQVTATLEKLTGERVGLITGETMPLERSAVLSDFKDGRLRWLVNCDVLTTGFNARCVDAIAVLRTTMSPGLFAQICGRGLRKHESKSNCLVLDFGSNIARHGSIDDPQYGRVSDIRRGSDKATVAAANNGRGKQCAGCGMDCHALAKECPECGLIFPVSHNATADSDSTLTGPQVPETWDVGFVSYRRHVKKDSTESPPTLRVDYECSPAGEEAGNLNKTTISEWVCVEHTGFAKTKAGLWWSARSEFAEPETVVDALELATSGALRKPSKITTVKEGKWYRIKSVEFETEKPSELVVHGSFSGVDEDVPF